MNRINFINIDLEIASGSDISPIIEEWGDEVHVFQNNKVDGIYYGSFETSCSGIDEIISKYHSLVMCLSPGARAIWDAAINRELDIGYNSGTHPNNFHSKISAQSLAKVLDMGAYLTITIYPVPDA